MPRKQPSRRHRPGLGCIRQNAPVTDGIGQVTAGSARAQRTAITEIGLVDRLERQTALMIPAGGAVGVTGRDVFHAAAAASLASSRNERDTAMAAQANLTELDLLAMPTVAEGYRRVGREAWGQYREMVERAKARLLRTALEDLAPPATLH